MRLLFGGQSLEIDSTVISGLIEGALLIGGPGEVLEQTVEASFDDNEALLLSAALTRFVSASLRIGPNNLQSVQAFPSQIDLGGYFSGTPGGNLKLLLFNDSVSLAGFGISAGQLDYVVFASGAHVFYLGTTKVAKLNLAEGLQTVSRRLQASQAADVVAASGLVIGQGNTVVVTGNTTIRRIDGTAWQDGATVRLHLTGTPTLIHAAGPSGVFVEMLLAGSVDLVVAAPTLLQLTLSTSGGVRAWRQSAPIVLVP
jgi:hypothetical protein